jgi:predicted RNA binding protein YcfA (HicA-like mRNA interferase family)
VEYAREIRRLLRDAGYELRRQGRGDHEIWRHPETGKTIVLDAGTKNRHLANLILKQAGLPKAF